MDRAACAGIDPAMFFPDRLDAGSAEAAMKICRGCAVLRECRAFAMREMVSDGVWAGVWLNVDDLHRGRSVVKARRLLEGA